MSVRTVLDVVAPDRVGEAHAWTSLVQLETVAPREHELRVGQLRGRKACDRFGMDVRALGDRIRIAGVDGAEEFLGLTLKLLEIGRTGNRRTGMTSLLQ